MAKSNEVCVNCGAPLAEGQNFCPKCGTPRDGKAIRVCGKCGSILEEGQDYCPQCGTKYVQPLTEEETDSLIGTHADYYKSRFKEMDRSGLKEAWNWPAFLITPCWLMYRKMYGLGAAVIVIDLTFALFSGSLYYPVMIGISILFGLLGNYIYRKNVDEKAEFAAKLPKDKKEAYLTKNGGTNYVAAIICGVALVVVSIGHYLFEFAIQYIVNLVGK